MNLKREPDKMDYKANGDDPTELGICSLISNTD